MRSLCALTWQHYMKAAPGVRGLYPRPERRGFTPLLVTMLEVVVRVKFPKQAVGIPYLGATNGGFLCRESGFQSQV